jgi:hypothetical protein
VNGAFGMSTDEKVVFLRELLSENASIDLDVVNFGNDAWAIHGLFPYDGEVPMAVFDSYAAATQALQQVCGVTLPLHDA